MKVKNWKKIAIVIIWSLNVLLLLFEHHQVKQLKILESRLDGILATRVLVMKNKKLGKEILKASCSLYTTADEPLLGWLEIENNLLESAKRCSLKNILINSPPEFTGNGDSLYLYPINISFLGRYRDALQWISSVENHFLYVDILKVVVSCESASGDKQEETYNIVLRARLRKITTAENTKVGTRTNHEL